MAERWQWTEKDPNERIRRGINWTTRLAGDPIMSSTWIVPPGLTMVTHSFTETRTQLTIEGGTTGQTYEIVNRVTTIAGDIRDVTVRLPVRNK